MKFYIRYKNKTRCLVVLYNRLIQNLKLFSYVPSQTRKRKISSVHHTVPQPEGCRDHLRPAERWPSHSNRLCNDVTSCKLHLKLPGLTHSSLCFIYRATTDPHGQQLPERESLRMQAHGAQLWFLSHHTFMRTSQAARDGGALRRVALQAAPLIL